jgi:DNA-binding NtrC family response regulator
VGEERGQAVVGLNADGFGAQEGFSLYDYLAEFEKRFIIKALKEQRGIKKRAADWLNIPETTLRLKLKQNNIDPKRLELN